MQKFMFLLKRVVLLLILLGMYDLVKADQTVPDFDSSYYKTYHRDVIVRVYSSRKYSILTLSKKGGSERLQYRPNTNVNLGIGATYRKVSLNLAYGFGFMNPDEGKGKTKKLDLQARLYSRKWIIDLSGEFFAGYYLFPKGKQATSNENYYSRPDVKLAVAGGSVYRIFNYKKLSFRQGFVKDEYQTRSAGSFLAGAAINYADVSGDSSMVPQNSTGVFNVDYLLRIRSWILSPGVGYAYTLVLPAHFYASGMVGAQLNLALVKETFGGNVPNEGSVKPGFSYKFSAGYYDGNWGLSGFWVSNRLSVSAPSSTQYLFNTGLFRIELTKRLSLSSKAKKAIAPIDGIINLISKDKVVKEFSQ